MHAWERDLPFFSLKYAFYIQFLVFLILFFFCFFTLFFVLPLLFSVFVLYCPCIETAYAAYFKGESTWLLL